MRYFCYIENGNKTKTTVIKMNETAFVEFYPERAGWTCSKSYLLSLYEISKRSTNDWKMFEICENQFNKFKNKGITPENWE